MAATCFQCKKDLEDSQLRCDLCYNSYHPKCCDVSNTKLKALVSIRDMVTWMCPTCTKLNPIEKLNLILGVQKELQGKLDKLSKDVEEMKSQQIIMKPTQPEDLIGEIEERHRKKKNLLSRSEARSGHESASGQLHFCSSRPELPRRQD